MEARFHSINLTAFKHNNIIKQLIYLLYNVIFT